MRKKQYKEIIERYEDIISHLAVENRRNKRRKSQIIMDLVDLKRSLSDGGEIVDSCIQIVRKNFE